MFCYCVKLQQNITVVSRGHQYQFLKFMHGRRGLKSAIRGNFNTEVSSIWKGRANQMSSTQKARPGSAAWSEVLLIRKQYNKRLGKRAKITETHWTSYTLAGKLG